MKKLILLTLLFFSSPALAQPILCPDQPLGNSTNACANTRFVIANAGSGGTSTLTLNHIFIGNGSNVATDTAMNGDCSITFAGGAITCTKSSGNVILGMAFQAANAVTITGGTAALTTGQVATTPTAATDLANKSYVDSVASGRTPLAPVRLATTAALPAVTYANGAAGVGATLTANVVGVLTVDSVAPASTDRILVKDQAAQLQNGCYTLTTVGTGGVAFVLTRCTDSDTAAEMPNGLTTFVSAGTINLNSNWTLNQPAAITVGTTALPWVQTGVTAVSYWTLAGSAIFNNNAGNVGIGTSTPSQLLDIHAASGNPAFAITDAAGANAIFQTVDSTDPNGARLQIGTSNNNPVAFLVNNDITKALWLATSGFVGINIKTPTQVLEVHGGSNPGIAITDSSGASGVIGTVDSTDPNGARLQMYTSTNHPIAIFGNGDITKALWLNTSGQASLGTSTPASGATVQVGNGTASSIYVNSQNPTLQQAVCYGFGAGNCETDGFLSHLVYTSGATTTGAAVRGEVNMQKAGATALGTTGVSSNYVGVGVTGSNSELVGVIGVADWNNAGTGTAVWAITEGTGATAGTTHAFEGTNGASFTPTWGLLINKEGAATQSFHIGVQVQDAVDYGVVVGGAGTSLVPTTPFAYINTAGTTLFFVDNAGVVHGASDSRLKNDLGLMPSGALQRISMLIPRNFSRKDDPTSRLESGFFAQEVQYIIPEAVTEGADGMLSMTEGPMIANLVGAIKELKADNDNLRACQATWKCRIFGWR